MTWGARLVLSPKYRLICLSSILCKFCPPTTELLFPESCNRHGLVMKLALLFGSRCRTNFSIGVKAGNSSLFAQILFIKSQRRTVVYFVKHVIFRFGN